MAACAELDKIRARLAASTSCAAAAALLTAIAAAVLTTSGSIPTANNPASVTSNVVPCPSPVLRQSGSLRRRLASTSRSHRCLVGKRGLLGSQPPTYGPRHGVPRVFRRALGLDADPISARAVALSRSWKARLDAQVEITLAALQDRHTARLATRRVICGAKTRKGTACRNQSEPGKARCNFHGGKSTGARTPEGRARIADAQRHRWAAYRAGLSQWANDGLRGFRRSTCPRGWGVIGSGWGASKSGRFGRVPTSSDTIEISRTIAPANAIRSLKTSLQRDSAPSRMSACPVINDDRSEAR